MTTLYISTNKDAGTLIAFSFLSRAFIAGGIAACGAVTVTHSFETVKIRYVMTSAHREAARPDGDCYRLQLQGELQSKKDAPKMYRGVFHGIKVILQNEGPKGLFRGIGSAVCTILGKLGWGDWLSIDTTKSIYTRFY
jgi:solute carrier family 25 protein 34/35